jgi:16S rRNA (adenine1518-N6/adenine1519-N6)-dimethyltransferase
VKSSQSSSRKAGTLLTQTRGMLHRYNLRARKGLGQHFLIDEEILGLIVSTAELEPDDIVLEVGPGLGVLTRELAEKTGQVIAIELDDKLAAILNQSLASLNNITIINENVLDIDPAVMIEEQRAGFFTELQGSLTYKVVANLPYYITSPVLRHFLEVEVKPQVMVVMVQKEVAEDIVARPGKMSLLSVSVHLYGEPVIAGYVPAACFYPAPEVDSAILKIMLYQEPAVDIGDTNSFFTLVRAGFTASRKQLANSLAQGLEISKPDSISLLEKADISPQRRAETLTLDEWANLWRIYAKVGE